MSDLKWWQRQLTPDEMKREQMLQQPIYHPNMLQSPPAVVRLSDEDVERIARAVVRLLHEEQWRP